MTINKLNNIPNFDQLDKNFDQVGKNFESPLDNYPKIVDICKENTERYCKKINGNLSELITKFDFKETYKKTTNTDYMPV